MAGFSVLITSVIFITIVIGETLQLVALVGLTALTSTPNPATAICTNFGSNRARTNFSIKDFPRGQVNGFADNLDIEKIKSGTD